MSFTATAARHTCAEAKTPITVAVTGAAGQIGYALLFRIANGCAFGADQPVFINMLEYNDPGCIKRAEGVAMELQDCAFPLLRGVRIFVDPMEGFKGIDYAVLVGAAPRGPGMDRADLLKKNASIFIEQGRALEAVAKKTVRVWVVGNPANTNCLICATNAPSIPRENFVAMTRLDHNRMLGQLADKIDMPTSCIHGVCIFGNHSDTMVPCLDQTYVSCGCHTEPTPICKVLREKQGFDDEGLKAYIAEFTQTIKKRGSAVIAARGASSAASAANAIVNGIHSWHCGTKDGEYVSMSVLTECTHGAYGVKPGVCFSFPCSCKDGKWSVVSLDITPETEAAIRATEAELFDERHKAGLE